MNHAPSPEGCFVHVEIDSLAVAAEKLRDPRLVDRPVAVADSTVRSCCAVARRHGLYPGLPTQQAYARCPDLEVVPERKEAYAVFADRTFEICRQYAPVLQTHGDRAFCDLTGVQSLYSFAVFARDRESLDVALNLRDHVRREVGLTVSLGIARTRTLAQIATRTTRPGGLAVIPAAEEDKALSSLPVRFLPGVGPRTANALDKLGVQTIGQVRELPKPALIAHLGRHGPLLYGRSRGEDTAVLLEDEVPDSIEFEVVPTRPTADPRKLEAPLPHAAEFIAESLRAQSLRARGVSVKVVYSDGVEPSSRDSLPAPTRNSFALLDSVIVLRRSMHARRVPVERLNIAVSSLCADSQAAGGQQAPGAQAPGAQAPGVDLRSARHYGVALAV